MKATTEKAFEAYIQEILEQHGWINGSNSLWDKQKALFPEYILAFIKDTQGDLWNQDEDKPLSEIIQTVNDRFGTDFTEEDRLFFEQIKEKATNDERIIQTAMANPLDKFELGIKAIIESLMMQRMSENDSIVTRYMEDHNFQKAIFHVYYKKID